MRDAARHLLRLAIAARFLFSDQTGTIRVNLNALVEKSYEIDAHLKLPRFCAYRMGLG
jgi:hypothetical protein